MPVPISLLLPLATAVAKAIFKAWTKDSAVASSAGSSVLDFVSSRITDEWDQRQAERRIHDISDKIGRSLVPILQESRTLDEGSLRAVLAAASDTFDADAVTASVLANVDFDPAALAKYLYDRRHDSTSGLSPDEMELYRRVLLECCRYVVRIASQLPAFDESVFAEVLIRENRLITTVDLVLEEVRRIREESERSNPEEQLARFETAYRMAVIDRLDRLEVLGVDDEEASNRTYPLSLAYVTLSVTRSKSNPAGVVPSPDGHRIPPDQVDADDSEAEHPVSVDDVLEDADRLLLITGDAGSGKTTFLRWIAVRCASRSFPQRLAAWNQRVPLFIRLRQYVDKPLPEPEAFLEGLATTGASVVPPGWVREQLESGNAVVLIDGVDEVPEEQRLERIFPWIDRLTRDYEHAQFVVTSRPYAVRTDPADSTASPLDRLYAAETGALQDIGFQPAELRPMEEIDAVNAFIDRWHDAVATTLGKHDDRTSLLRFAEDLKLQIEESVSLRELVSSPLLCAMTCALHRLHGETPENRVELYEQGCDLLIRVREKRKRIDLRNYPPLEARQIRALLEDFAYWLLRNGRSEATEAEVDERFAVRLQFMEGLDNVTGSSARRLIIERTSMLRDPVVGKIGFTHRTFQEFLAAHEAVNQRDIGVLVSNAHDWPGVVTLAAGLTKNSDDFNALVRGLLERGDQELDRRHRLHLLAVACLKGSLGVQPDVKTKVMERLAALVPPKNMSEAKELYSARDLAVPHLRKFGVYRATVTAAIVRTLSLIRSDAAVEALEDYADDGRQVVRKELLRAWENSRSPDDFGRRMLPRIFAGENTVVIEHATSLEGLGKVTWATELNVDGLGPDARLDSLAGIANAVTLRLGNAPRTVAELGLGPLAGLTGLRRLVLGNWPGVTDLAPLAELSNLTELELRNFPDVHDLGPLARLVNLERLVLGGCESVSDLAPLANLSGLTELTLNGFPTVGDLGPLAWLVNLSRLELGRFGMVTNLAPLGRLANLTELVLGDRTSDLHLIDLDNEERQTLHELEARIFGYGHPIESHWDSWGFYRHFRTTRLFGARVPSGDLGPLAQLRKLERAEIGSFGKTNDVTPLSRLAKLRSLSLSALLQAPDLSPLTQLPTLAQLDLNGYGWTASPKDLVNAIEQLEQAGKQVHPSSESLRLIVESWRSSKSGGSRQLTV